MTIKAAKMLALAGLATFSMASIAADKLAPAQSENLYVITDADIKAVPELADELQNKATGALTGATMKCLVDTPRYDRWGTGRCFSVGFARRATAYFQIDNAPANRTIYWSDSRCSATSTSCALPIYTYQSITLTATILDNSNNTFTRVTATAHYEGMD